MQKAYNKLDIVFNIAVCTHISTIKLANLNHANCYTDTISGYHLFRPGNSLLGA